ncbi:hypothetical protein GALMADRAFT_252713 [Galerina marginata CBS 339.88]|uniref:Uncharacterized protein n=1 Tax=Galerina marginata (strain CBS 339.88) TaxID=685588 RepID=A0A067SNR4_GALM3|nr:hypothetical protein GALMADRAFT_252713 [Galerina marginata CBS 339.88]
MVSSRCIISNPHLRNESFDNRGPSITARDASLSAKLDLMAQGLQDLALQETTSIEVDHGPILHDDLIQHFDSLQKLGIAMARKEELTYARVTTLETTIEELETLLRSTQEERKKVAQELKHTENERLKANERARNAEEKLKKALEQGEEDRKKAALERTRALQFQMRIDELQRNTGPCDDVKAKKTKEKDTAPDVSGLQRGLERVKGQLKKKQDEFQAQAQALQQASVKVKNLEQSIADDRKRMESLQDEVHGFQRQMEEERIQMRSERLNMDMERKKGGRQLMTEKDRFRELEVQTSADRARLKRLLDQEEERSDRLEEKVNKLEAKLSDLQDSVNYEALGDADIADRIRIRNLVDQVQERLASCAGLTPSGPGELLSLTWRVALGPSMDDLARVQKARDLLADKDLDEHDRAFIANHQVMLHACRHYSRFRKPGNDLHQFLGRDGYMTSVQRYLRFNPSDTAADALVSMVNYVCPTFTSPI